MSSTAQAKRNFILQQGFEQVLPGSCSIQYSALQFQPRVILVWVVAGMLLQSPALFGALCAVLWFSAAFPKLNPFEAVYNRMMGRSFRLDTAPSPRRAAQSIAGTLSLLIAVSIRSEWTVVAYATEAFFLAAVLAVTTGAFCVGSFMYHLLRGQSRFALATLPWSR